MPPKTTLNAKNLEALGAERLAALLMEVSAGDAAAKRKLRMALVGLQAPGEVSREIRKRLTAVANARSRVGWRSRKALVADLDGLRSAIAEQVAGTDPVEALDLMWRFLELGAPVFARCEDRTGTVMAVFEAAVADLASLAAAAKADPMALAERACRALCDNGDGQYDGLIVALAPVLGADGLEHLKALLLDLAKTPPPKPPQKERVIFGWSTAGPIYADDVERSARASAVRLALQAIADLQGDVDAFIAQQSGKARTAPGVAVEIARRLLAAGRAAEALQALDAVDTEARGWIPLEWEQARADTLEALGRREAAQAFRWSCFERSLEPAHLRAFLKRLPDFDDMEAEERAMAYALRFPAVHQALAFFLEWPAPDKAARLVTARAGEIDGDHYQILTPAAEVLEADHPLAATILRRAMIDFTLGHGRSSRYRHAARDLQACAVLAGRIDDAGGIEAHDAYVAGLRMAHGRKSGFWRRVS